ncbi:hypothetical protein GCM10025866_16320 [Naasia aerilata]|uniref:Major facilitator superfamily (MFS) profile domain-containing protein n=1 Tax=Naasia aerilata TaxID=1162966 RepID=A0ABM8GBV5_9MICO|nr:hypothetical protein GCM10025866_16320 [Naasia aerilata]
MTAAIHPGDALSRAQLVLFVIVLGALVGLGPFTIDMYLPAFPVLTKDFGVSDAAVQLTLTGTTIGFGLGQLVVGPLSDRFGRRIPLLAATTLHVLACVGAALAQDVTVLGLFRVLQGIGAAGGGVVAMAMMRDLFGGRALVRMLSRLALVTSLAPVVAPVIGSQLLRAVDWRGLFLTLAGYGLVMVIIAALCLRETMQRAEVTESPAAPRAKGTGRSSPTGCSWGSSSWAGCRSPASSPTCRRRRSSSRTCTGSRRSSSGCCSA